MSILVFTPAALLCVLPSVALSDDSAEVWSCSVHFESQCSDSTCVAFGEEDDGNKKPVSALFNEDGYFRICIYTGCYDGKGQVLTTAPFLSIMQEDVEWKGSNPNKTDVFIVLERKELLGMFKADSFVQPIICKVVKRDE